MQIEILKIGVVVYSVTRPECISIAQMGKLKFGETEKNAILLTRRTECTELAMTANATIDSVGYLNTTCSVDI